MKKMKKYILFILYIIQLSCSSDNKKTNFEDIITQKGDYTYIVFDQKDKKSITFKIKIVKIEGQGYVFGIADSQNKTLYQSSIFTTFNSYSKWGIYFEKRTYDVWIYIGDYHNMLLLKYVEGKYIENKYDKNEYSMPKHFKNWLNN